MPERTEAEKLTSLIQRVAPSITPPELEALVPAILGRERTSLLRETIAKIADPELRRQCAHAAGIPPASVS